MERHDERGQAVKEKIQIILMIPIAILLAVLTYLDWYVFGNMPERKF